MTVTGDRFGRSPASDMLTLVAIRSLSDNADQEGTFEHAVNTSGGEVG